MKRILSIFIVGGAIISTLSFTACEKKDKLSASNNDKIKNITLQKEDEKKNSIDLGLYFDASTSKDKAEVTKEERVINKDELLGEIIMQELLKGPANVSSLKPILPKDTRLLSFSIKDGIAYVSLSAEAETVMTPSKEEACLRSIVNSLTQISSINKVKIMVDNKDTNWLGGNFDVSKPFGKEDIPNMAKK